MSIKKATFVEVKKNYVYVIVCKDKYNDDDIDIDIHVFGDKKIAIESAINLMETRCQQATGKSGNYEIIKNTNQSVVFNAIYNDDSICFVEEKVIQEHAYIDFPLAHEL